MQSVRYSRLLMAGLRFFLLLATMAFAFGPASSSAVHAVNCYDLTIIVSPAVGGTVSVNPLPDCDGKYSENTAVTLTAVPNPKYSFSSWAGDVTGQATQVIVTMEANKSVAAKFAPKNDNYNFATLITGLTFIDSLDTTEALTALQDDPADPNPVGPCLNGDEFYPGHKSLWYKYTPLVDESIQVDTIGSREIVNNQDLDTYIAVWRLVQANPRILEIVDCNDDYLASVTSRLSFVGLANTTYYFQVAQYNGIPGNEGTRTPPVAANLKFNVNITNTDVVIGGSLIDRFYIPVGDSTRESYNVDNGPVKVTNTAGIPSIAAMRAIWKVNGQFSSYSELMGLPKEQLSTEYWFPWYNNSVPSLLDEQFRFANADTTPTTVQVSVGSTILGTYPLDPGQSWRQSYTGLDNGPIRIRSLDNKKIIAAMRAIWLKNGQFNSYSELMGLPKEQLSTEYWFPWYNNSVPSLLDEQFRFANADATPTTIEASVGSTILGTYPLGPGQSWRQSYPGLDNGPIRIRSLDNKKIIAAMRAVWIVGGQYSSYSELMGLPKEQLSTEYWFPWYNYAVPSLLDEQFRFANADATPTTVEVSVGSTSLGTYDLDPGESWRQSYPGLDNGPIRIRSLDNKKIIAAMRAIWLKNGQFNSYSELMGLPKELLSSEYWFPWYNNIATTLLDEQFRLGVP